MDEVSFLWGTVVFIVMIYGGIETETLALNESTMWSGEYDEHQQRPFGREKLNQVRKLFFEI